jgi:hypothetical protein
MFRTTTELAEAHVPPLTEEPCDHIVSGLRDYLNGIALRATVR